MNWEFNPGDYRSPIDRLVDIDRFRVLVPERPDESMLDELQQLRPDAIAGETPISDETMAAAAVSGVWLLHDFLDESHAVSQGIDTPTGSYWHGVMHRREGDYSNAKYWFRRAGDHPVLAQVAAAVAEVGLENWDPFRFVDACQQAAGDDELAACRRVQQIEWERLFDYSYRQAVGG